MTRDEGVWSRSKKPVAFGVAVFGGLALLGGGSTYLVLRRPYTHATASMYPTIGYGGRVSANLLDRKLVRGEVMLFRPPEDTNSLLALRVIGLEGDRIEGRSDRIAINGWEIPRCALGELAWPFFGATRRGTLVVEFLGRAAYLVFIEHDASIWKGGPWQVKRGEFFVLGDDRADSDDSRYWFRGKGGGVPLDDIVGKVRDLDRPVLPKEASALAPALEACLANRPSSADPPPPSSAE
jgi:signal peptidase I